MSTLIPSDKHGEFYHRGIVGHWSFMPGDGGKRFIQWTMDFGPDNHGWSSLLSADVGDYDAVMGEFVRFQDAVNRLMAPT